MDEQVKSEPKQPEKRYILPDAIRGAMLKYMGERPYVEVANGIDMLLKLEELPPKE